MAIFNCYVSSPEGRLPHFEGIYAGDPIHVFYIEDLSAINPWLAGGFNLPYPSEKWWTNRQWGWDDIPMYEMENKIHVWNHHTLSHFAMRVALVKRYPAWVWSQTKWGENCRWKHRMFTGIRKGIQKLRLTPVSDTRTPQHPFVNSCNSVARPRERRYTREHLDHFGSRSSVVIA